MAPNTTPVPVAAPTPAATDAPARPEWLPAKFATPEAMAVSYAELEAKLSAPKPAAPAAPVAAPAPEPSNVPDNQAAAALPTIGVSPDDLEAEYFENSGKLTDATYKKLEGIGWTREQADRIVQGQAALSEKTTQGIYAEIGGQEVWNRVATWAKGNLSDREKTSFNAAIGGKDATLLGMAVRGLHARYVSTAGNPPNLLDGGSGSVDGLGYASLEQAKLAMADPRYAKDPAYRRSVEANLAAAPVFSTRTKGH